MKDIAAIRRRRREGMRRRIYYFGLVVTAVAIIQLVRLAWLQWLPHSPAAPAVHHYQDYSVNQRERGLLLDTGRADFADRKGRAMTGETVMTLAAFPVNTKLWTQAGQLDKLAAILNTSPVRLYDWLSKLREPGFYHRQGEKLPYRLSGKQLEQLGAMRLEGIRVLPYHVRYKPPYAAMHAIGYISQHPERLETLYGSQLEQGKLKLHDRIGGAGLEKSLDSLLHGIGGVAVSHYTDGVNKPLHGLDMRLVRSENPYYPLKVVTTLDLEIQDQLEHYLDKQGLKEGAVVVLDAKNADIVAMVSRPAYDPYRLDAGGKEMINRAIHAIAPGSVFKLVTEAAALEAGEAELDEMFHCNGEYGKYGLSCWKPGGHGTITLREGLAQSCNIAFARLGERLQYQQFMQTADRLGLGKQVGWVSEQVFKPLGQTLRLLQEEEGGRLFTALPKGRDGGLLAQTAIGQRDVAVSPLQAANLVVTLLHNGQVRAPRIVSEIRYANGHLMSSLPVRNLYSPYGRVAPATARALIEGMEDVVAYGTGTSLQAAKWRLAGKSGTAQTLFNGKERNHQWFVGYGPVQAPRYSVAVVAENRLSGSHNQSTILFRGVMDILAEQPSG